MGQKKIILSIHIKGQENALISKKNIINEFKDSLSAITSIKNLILDYHKKGFLLSGAEGILKTHDTLYAYVNVGKQFHWANLHKGNVSEEMLSTIGFREKIYKEKIFSYQQVEKLERDILNHSENNGYPFATIKLDSINIQQDKINASLLYDSGLPFVFDSISIIGTARVRPKFLASYLRIFTGQPYDQEKVNNIDIILKQLPFLKITAPVDVIFKNEKAYILIYADNKKSNQFDGIIGFAPNQLSSKTGSKLLITGEVNFQMKNLFTSGKTFSLVWKQVRPQSPLLNVQYIHPNLFRTPLEVDVQLNLLKQDSSFLNVFRKAALSERISRNQKAGINIALQTSSPLGSNVKYDTIKILPNVLNTKYLSYGLQYNLNSLNDILYPSKGWDLQIQGSIGTKTIIKNSFISDQYYDGISLNSVQSVFKSDLKKYCLLRKRSVILLRLQSAKIWNENLFQNELFRLGGLNSLRGFNENTFYASEYSLGTIEYRFFIDKDAYLYTFFDYAYYKYQTKNISFSDKPFGTGLGISFSTPNGIFNFVYASGKSAQQTFGLNFSKIHFGYTSRF